MTKKSIFVFVDGLEVYCFVVSSGTKRLSFSWYPNVLLHSSSCSRESFIKGTTQMYRLNHPLESNLRSFDLLCLSTDKVQPLSNHRHHSKNYTHVHMRTNINHLWYAAPQETLRPSYTVKPSPFLMLSFAPFLIKYSAKPTCLYSYK